MDSIAASAGCLSFRLSLALFGTQIRRFGAVAVLVPVAAGAILAGIGAAWLYGAGRTPALLAMMAFTELYPVAVGMCAVSVLAGDSLVEVQGSTPVGFRSVQTVRLVVVLIGGFLGAIAMFAPLHLLGIYPRDTGWASFLFPAGGAAVMAFLAYSAVSLSGAAATASLAVAAAWLFLALIWDPNMVSLASQRGIPLLAACAACSFAWRSLGNVERALPKARDAQ